MEITTYGDHYVVRFYYKGKHPKLTNKEWKVDDYSKAEIRKVALRAIQEKMDEIDKAKVEEAKKPLYAIVEGFLADDNTVSKKSTNLLKRRTLSKYFLGYFDKEKEADCLTTKSVSDYRMWIADQGFGYSSNNHVLTMTKQLFDYMAIHEDIDPRSSIVFKNLLKPFKKDECAEEEEVGDNFWTREEFDAFINTFDEGDPYRYFFIASYYGATRLGETLGLKFSDFDYAKAELSIKRQVTRESGVTSLKTTSSKDTNRVPKKFIEEIMNYQLLMKASDSDFLFFPTRELPRTTIRKQMDKHIEMAKVKPITIHGLRHSMASYLLANGFSPTYVAHYLRHSSSNTTMRTYAHWIKTDEDDKIDMI